MKLQFKFIRMIKARHETKNCKAALRCGICMHSRGYEDNAILYTCASHEKETDKIYSMDKNEAKAKSVWCSGFTLDETKWKQL